VSNVSSVQRTQVSIIVAELAKQENLNAFVGLAGSAVKTGRRGVKSEYIEAMLNAKILVVTQRDDWEDHYRLFEAMISGALVLTDRMLGMPQGLIDGTSIIEFGSEADLKQKILYYLAQPLERKEIARRGREVAMTRHRTWHRIEEVIFGGITSTCSPDKPDSPCPWIVHANEARRRRRR
jgi:glycosyltransferase involved in cell wall biosynthesis